MSEGYKTEQRERSAKGLSQNEFPPLPRLATGSKLTPLSPQLMNPIITMYNAMRAMRGGPGINTVVSAGGIVVELTNPETVERTDPNAGDATQGGAGGGGSGNMNFRGAWASGTTDYAENDVVTHASSNQNGLFIAGSGISGNGGDPWTGGTGQWTLIGRIFTDLLKVTDGANTFTWNAANATFLVEFNDGGSVQMSKANVAGKDLYVQEVGICDAGTAKLTRVIACDPYT